MTLTAAVAPLAAYAVFFQTAIYLSLPAPLRSRWAPTFTGAVGAIVALASGILFGFDRIGLGATDPAVVLAWALAAVLMSTAAGTFMLRRPSLRTEMADPRVTMLGRRQAAAHIFVRIPLLTALVEELFFRGVLHAALMALYPTPVAIWLGAGLFGLWHIGPGLDQAEASEKTTSTAALHTGVTVIATTLAGAFLVWLRIETGSIWAPVAVHAAVNMTMALFARLAAVRERAAALD
jgi:membrane protease YdiL (CAAX protease family)